MTAAVVQYFPLTQTWRVKKDLGNHVISELGARRDNVNMFSGTKLFVIAILQYLLRLPNLDTEA